jgi:hypothetical protein
MADLRRIPQPEQADNLRFGQHHSWAVQRDLARKVSAAMSAAGGVSVELGNP